MPSATTTTGAKAWLLCLCLATAPHVATADDQSSRDARHRAVTTVVAASSAVSSPLSQRAGALQVAALAEPVRAPQTRCDGPDARALRAVLPIATDNGSHASGVVFAEDHVLTAAHAVQGASRFFVRTGADFRRADLISVDHDTDLAVLAIDTGSIQPLPLSRAALGSQDRVWAVGFPRAKGLTTSSGFFQRVDDGAVHTSASIDSGQSGGGLLTCHHGQYAIAGMLRGYGAYRSGDRFVKLSNHSVSVAAHTIRRFLNATSRQAH